MQYNAGDSTIKKKHVEFERGNLYLTESQLSM